MVGAIRCAIAPYGFPFLQKILDACCILIIFLCIPLHLRERYRDADWRGAGGGACGRGADVVPRTREASGSRPCPLRGAALCELDGCRLGRRKPAQWRAACPVDTTQASCTRKC